MPWKERTIMDERIGLSLCREFQLSRKTGYKIFDRYQECGLEGLADRVRRPFRYGDQLPFQVETAILTLKREKSHWGYPWHDTTIHRQLRTDLFASQENQPQHRLRRSSPRSQRGRRRYLARQSYGL